MSPQALELRLRDRRLGGLDRVQHGETLEQIVPCPPGGRAVGRPGQRRGVLGRAKGAGEAVPQRDVGALLGGVLGEALGVSTAVPGGVV